MKFVCEPEVLDYLQKKKAASIVIEVITSDSSDFDLTELRTHAVNERQAKVFIKDKHYRQIDTEWGSVLLPKYVLEYEETVTFSLKKVLWFYKIEQKGVSL